MFAGPLRMHHSCPRCGHVFIREPGFFQGAMYVSYGLGIAAFFLLARFLTAALQGRIGLGPALVLAVVCCCGVILAWTAVEWAQRDKPTVLGTVSGAVVYARKRPDPWPRIFGFHELFHALQDVAGEVVSLDGAEGVEALLARLADAVQNDLLNFGAELAAKPWWVELQQGLKQAQDQASDMPPGIVHLHCLSFRRVVRRTRPFRRLVSSSKIRRPRSVRP